MSLACGVSAAAMMGTAALIGSRSKWVESIFGGLDRIYLTRKWLAVWPSRLRRLLVLKAAIDTWTTASIVALLDL